MLKSIQGFVGEFFGRSGDGRKREYGDLKDLRMRNSQKGRSIGQRGRSGRFDVGASRLGRSREQNLDREERLYQEVQDRRQDNRVRKVNRPVRHGRMGIDRVDTNGSAPSWRSKLVSAVKSAFSNDANEMTSLANSSEFLLARKQGALSREQELRRMRDRIAKSAVFKRKLLEQRHDKELLEQMRNGRYNDDSVQENNINESLVDKEFYRTTPAGSNFNLADDQVQILQRKLKDMEVKLNSVTKELHTVKKRLKFTKEKKALLESLLDDANIDSEYVKSRRDIKNLQKENLIPESELPPSPRRTVNPLFTSSPMRKQSQTQQRTQPTEAFHTDTNEYYNKYPKIPETELLVQEKKDRSLSPIRIDYSKYSSPH